MNTLIRSAVCGVLPLMALDGWAEEPVTPIGYLLINPTALHRKALKLAGVTHNVAAYSEDGTVTKQLYCGADLNWKTRPARLKSYTASDVRRGNTERWSLEKRCMSSWKGNMEAPPTIM